MTLHPSDAAGSSGSAWYEAARAHHENKRYAAAIDCYRKALDSPDSPAAGVLWNHLGLPHFFGDHVINVRMSGVGIVRDIGMDG